MARTYSRLDFFRAAMTDALYTYLHNVEPADAETAAIISADYISAYAAVSKLHLDAYKPTLTVTIGVHKFTMTRTQAKD